MNKKIWVLNFFLILASGSVFANECSRLQKHYLSLKAELTELNECILTNSDSKEEEGQRRRLENEIKEVNQEINDVCRHVNR